MSSARRTSVQRHIDNPNIHGGRAGAIPFAEYSAGIRWGHYKVGRKPSFGSSEEAILLRIVKKTVVEFENEIAKQVAKRLCKTVDETYYHTVEVAARKRVWLKQYKESFGKDF
jgi:hypothetical protein